LLITGEPPKQAEDRKKPNPSACTGLAEHLLPRRHGLIQSFPRLPVTAETLAALISALWINFADVRFYSPSELRIQICVAPRTSPI